MQKPLSCPRDLPFHLQILGYPQKTSIFGVMSAVFGTFEDVYYAAVAKHKELEHHLKLMIENQFKREKDTYFQYQTMPLCTLGPVSVGDFKDFLATQIEILRDEALISILTKGVNRANARGFLTTEASSAKPRNIKRLEASMKPLLDVHNMNSAMIYGHLAEKYHFHKPADENGAQTSATLEKFKAFADVAKRRQAARQRQMKEKEDAIRHAEVVQMAAKRHSCSGAIKCAESVIYLKAQAYPHDEDIQDFDMDIHQIAQQDADEEDLAESDAEIDDCNEENDEMVMDDEDSIMTEVPEEAATEQPAQVYISPYNLNERAKIWTKPGVAEKPCICDSDCLCYSLCQTDLTQNCLCEDNPSFVRVTEGASIDDLDVPDLVRLRKKYTRRHRTSQNNRVVATSLNDAAVGAASEKVARYSISSSTGAMSPKPALQPEPEPEPELVWGLDYVSFGEHKYMRPLDVSREEFTQWLRESPYEMAAEPPKWPSKRAEIKSFLLGRNPIPSYKRRWFR